MTRTHGIVFCLVVALAAPTPARSQTQRSAYEELQTFSGVLNHIRLNYPDSLSYSELVAAAIRGVLRALDPHSYYVSRLEYQRQNALERGELVTVGVQLEDVEGAATVLAVAPGVGTREDLARLAVAVDDAGRRIDGIVVADPDASDRTTGRRTLEERARQATLPVRMTGSVQGPASMGKRR